MAYVQVPKDMTEVQSRLILNLTKRQVICFGVAAAIGIPVYIFANRAFGGTPAMLMMVAAALPAFFFAIYKKDGIPAEKFILLVIRQKFIYPPIRSKKGGKEGVKNGGKSAKPKKASAASPTAATKSRKTGAKQKAPKKGQGGG